RVAQKFGPSGDKEYFHSQAPGLTVELQGRQDRLVARLANPDEPATGALRKIALGQSARTSGNKSEIVGRNHRPVGKRSLVDIQPYREPAFARGPLGKPSRSLIRHGLQVMLVAA